MTTPEPTFAVPLSALVKLEEWDEWGSWVWRCLLDCPESRCAVVLRSQAEARSAAIAHLATVHGLTVQANAEEIVRKAFERSGEIVDPEALSCALDEIAEKASGSWERLSKNGFEGVVPLAVLSHLLTVTTALREVLGLPPSRTARETREHGAWLPEYGSVVDRNE